MERFATLRVAQGIDNNPVISNRVRKQISAENTFLDDR
jgi:nucleotidyltransferase/DNA polymerase involved in DNA repair